MYLCDRCVVMPIRSQTYLWDAGRTSSSAGVSSTAVNTNQEGKPIEVFSGDSGNKNTSSQTQKKNTFVVVERVAVTPTYYTCGERTFADPNPTFRGLPLQYGVAGPRAFIQPKVNDTSYFVSPDGTQSIGMAGSAIPFPVQPQAQSSLEPTLYNRKDTSGDNLRGPAPFNIYIRNGQTWDIGVVFTNGGAYQEASTTQTATTSVNLQTIQPQGYFGTSIGGTV